MSKHPKPGKGGHNATSNQPHRTDHSCDVKGTIRVSGEIETHLPPNVEKQKATTANKKDSRDKKRFIVECVTMGLVAIYAGLTIWLGVEAQRSATAAERQTRIDQRPWLEFRFGDANSGDSGNVKTDIGVYRPVSVPSQFLNIGKTPAISIKGVTMLAIVDIDKDPMLPDRNTEIALTALGETIPRGEVSKGIMNGQVFEEAPIFPNRHSQFDVYRVKPSKERGVVETLVLTAEEYKSLISQKSYIVIWGEVRYGDIFGVSHWTRFCKTQGVGIEVSKENCVNYGDVDKSLDPP